MTSIRMAQASGVTLDYFAHLPSCHLLAEWELHDRVFVPVPSEYRLNGEYVWLQTRHFQLMIPQIISE